MKTTVGHIIMWRLIYDVGSARWPVLLKVVSVILRARGHSS